MSQIQEPADWLRKELLSRAERNPAYSQRAFARLLGVSSGRISELLSGKRAIGPRLAKRISARLAFPPDTHQRWVELVDGQKVQRSRHQKYTRLLSENLIPSDYVALSDDAFQYISDWHYLAILNLMRTADFKSDPNWVARRLGLTTKKVRDAYFRLERLNLIQLKRGQWIRTKSRLRTTQDIPSSAVRNAHRQTLALAIKALDEVPVEERDMTYMTMAIRPEKIEVAKRLIRNFRRAIADLLEEGTKTEVYDLYVALFPLSGRDRRRA